MKWENTSMVRKERVEEPCDGKRTSVEPAKTASDGWCWVTRSESAYEQRTSREIRADIGIDEKRRIG
jgi:hypothetical protein